MTTSAAADGNDAGAAGRGREADARGAGGGTDLSGRGSDGADSTLMAEQLTKLRPDRDLQCYFRAAVGGGGAERRVGERVHGFGMLAAAVRLGGGRVEPGQRVRASGAAQSAGRRPERAAAELRGDAHELHPDGLDAVSDGGLAVSADLGGIRRDGDAVQGSAEGSCDARWASIRLRRRSSSCRERRRRATTSSWRGWISTSITGSDGGDTLESAVAALAAIITANQATGAVSATASGAQIDADLSRRAGGERKSGRRVWDGARRGDGIWSPAAATVRGRNVAGAVAGRAGFRALHDVNGRYGADHECAEDAVDVGGGPAERAISSGASSRWRCRTGSVSGTKLQYTVAGPGSRRIEDDAAEIALRRALDRGARQLLGRVDPVDDYAGRAGDVHLSGERATLLYLGTRLADHGGQVVGAGGWRNAGDAGSAKAAEDVLVRVPIGAVSGAGAAHRDDHAHRSRGRVVYFDFLEIAYPSAALPDFDRCRQTTLATDWDTDHSIAIAPERTAWLIHKLGFQRQSESLCGRHVVLRAVQAGTQLCDRHDHIFRRAGVRQDDAGITWGRRRSNT